MTWLKSTFVRFSAGKNNRLFFIGKYNKVSLTKKLLNAIN